MSLINDALKRAKEAHENLPPPPPTAAVPQFRPVEPAPRPHIGPGVMLLTALCVLLLLGLLISWIWVQHNKGTIVVQASSRVDASTSGPTAPAKEPSPVVAPTSASPAPALAAASPSPASSIPPVSAAPAPAEPPPSEPAPVVAAEPPPLPKPTLKLQGIVYSPLRPAAMISGKTLFIGDKTGEWRVLAIDQESATLVSGSQTNVLTLAQ